MADSVDSTDSRNSKGALPSRTDAEALWRTWNDDESLHRHALSVEAAMRHFSLRYQGDPDEWGMVGFLHDLDYGRFPEEHLVHARPILTEAGYPEWFIRAIESHGWKLVNDVEPKTLLEKTLYAVDELTGLVTACVWVRPSRSVLDLELSSVKKKWKAAGFAAGVSREVVQDGAALLSMELDDLISETILGMRKAARELGLAGTLA